MKNNIKGFISPGTYAKGFLNQTTGWGGSVICVILTMKQSTLKETTCSFMEEILYIEDTIYPHDLSDIKVKSGRNFTIKNAAKNVAKALISTLKLFEKEPKLNSQQQKYIISSIFYNYSDLDYHEESYI